MARAGLCCARGQGKPQTEAQPGYGSSFGAVELTSGIGIGFVTDVVQGDRMAAPLFQPLIVLLRQLVDRGGRP